MTKLRVKLPGKELLISWSHPWVFTKKQGVDNVFTKVSQCFIAEWKGERVGEDGRIKAHVRFISQGIVKWPLYSWDGTKGHTYNTNGDFVSKPRGRKLSLKIALERAGLDRNDRTLIWHAYLKAFQPFVPIPPAIPLTALAVREGEVVDKIVLPLGRVLDFPGPISDPRRLLPMAPVSNIVH